MLSLEKNNGEGGEKEKGKKTRGEDESPKDPAEEMAPAHYVCSWRTACWETDGSNACVCAADLIYGEVSHPKRSMWLTLAALLTLSATGRSAENGSESSAVEEKLVIARGILMVVPVKKMKADEISSLLDSLGFYKRSQKGEEVPEEFKHFPLNAPRDEL
ncbi:hypothetical protein DPX16_21569 [Anabarilius grahami]|uniref:Selenoprotein M n=1 Tax=Anabarilius grahami TaxID=495550 RepID=A0A3N0XH44_ANAGA|nr:hypothetical protein DPX16_21569 [Anabarilius grahami]